MPEFTLPTLLSALAVSALVASDYRRWRPGRYLFKPLAALAFLWLAWQLDAGQSAYGRWVLLGLCCCALGDLLLMPDREGSFIAGLAAFLCGHLAYGVAFAQLGDNYAALAAGALPVLALLAGTGRWLAPHVARHMQFPVALYILIISAMLLCACLSAGHPAAWWIIPGAFGFALSDLAVARQQFVHPEPRNGLWGTPLYFGSQMLLAASVAAV
ncbi:lysoplasmalogenase [Parahaliea mediterranea]|uniref:Lysoplasmalogenase n=1 Tax=Parahaliea mediterranea TaxID=651086 RepID=A0A939DC13_9GAMM|nr:lysoplasmalogenase [Parahaliea mediterranea]MBN7795410.1 lysoplasmalogenase [Parahaliea mediterranea]